MRVCVCNFILSIIFWGVVACHNSPKQDPVSLLKPIIPKDSMVLILKDLYLIEGAFYQNTIKPYIPSEDHKEYNFVFKKYGYSLEDFKSSLEIYQQNPKDMIELDDEILEHISIEEAKLNTIPKP